LRHVDEKHTYSVPPSPQGSTCIYIYILPCPFVFSPLSKHSVIVPQSIRPCEVLIEQLTVHVHISNKRGRLSVTQRLCLAQRLTLLCGGCEPVCGSQQQVATQHSSRPWGCGCLCQWQLSWHAGTVVCIMLGCVWHAGALGLWVPVIGHTLGGWHMCGHGACSFDLQQY
jgi:hypothetical protein